LRNHLWLTTLASLLAAPVMAQQAVPPVAGTPHAALTDVQIKQHLEQQGYTNVTVGQHSKGHVDVTAMKGGKNQKLEVDPATGQARPETDND